MNSIAYQREEKNGGRIGKVGQELEVVENHAIPTLGGGYAMINSVATVRWYTVENCEVL